MVSYHKGRLLIVHGDITDFHGDAVVNAANSTLLGGAGVDGAIHKKGGPAILEACKEIRCTTHQDGLPAGEAVITAGGNLPAQYVIHTVGPVWRGGNQKEEETLKKAYVSSLRLATERALKRIAFPAISTGVYGFPKDKAAILVYDTVCSYLESNSLPEEVYLYFFSSSDYEQFLRTIPASDNA